MMRRTKNWCVGFSFPPPAYAGIHPTLYLFGFRADALNSHSPPYLPCLERFDTLSGSSGAGGSLRAPPGCLRGASGRLRGASGGLGGISGALSLFLGLDVGFGSGFRVFWPPSTIPCLADPKFQHFPGHLLETAGQWAPRATPRKPPRPRSLGLGFLNNLVNHRKGEGVP